MQNVEHMPRSFLASNIFYGLHPINRLLLAALNRVNVSRGLQELPLELLTEVLMFLNWQDILFARQTCKCLSEATRAKSIWMNLFNTANASLPYSPLHLERPMEFYASQELEYIVLRSRRMEVARKKGTKNPSLTRRIDIGDFNYDNLTLIPGGRWLLVASVTGSVVYYDLDAKEPIRRVLIPDQMECRSNFKHSVRMAVDVDNHSGFLAFNIGIYTQRFSYKLARKDALIQVWRVTLQFNDRRESSLSAERLSSLCRESFASPLCISILGDFIALGVVENDPQTLCCVSLINWAEAEATEPSVSPLSYERKIYLSPIPRNVRLLPGNSLLVVTEQYIALYDMLSIELTPNIPSFPPPTNETPSKWESRIGFQHNSLSQTYICRGTNTFRLVMKSTSAVHGLVIPWGNQEPSILTLMDVKVQPGRSFSLGYHSGIIHGNIPRLQTLHYPWPDDSSQFPVYSIIIEFDGEHWKERLTTFDEGSGRVVIVSRNEIIIFDFA